MKTKSFIPVVWACMLMPQFNYAQSKGNKQNMSAEETNKTIVRTIYEESLNKRNFELLKELIADEYSGVKGIKGAAGIEAAVMPLINSFPDIQWKVEELIAEGNKVVVKWRWQGLSTISYQNLAAVNKTICNEAIAIYELKEGKVITAQLINDRLGFLQQMEAISSDINSFTNKGKGKNVVRFIDKFVVPAKAKEVFLSRVKINRDFIKALPGFVEDHAYQSTDEIGNLIYLTIALWENEEVVKKAKESVQMEYKKQGFDMPAFLEQLNIRMDRALYKELN